MTGWETATSLHWSIKDYFSTGSCLEVISLQAQHSSIKSSTLFKAKINIVIVDSILYITRYFWLLKALRFRSCWLEDLRLLHLCPQHNHLCLDCGYCYRSLLEEKERKLTLFFNFRFPKCNHVWSPGSSVWDQLCRSEQEAYDVKLTLRIRGSGLALRWRYR